MSSAITTNHDEVLILDFGSQYSHLIARRVREANVYCELHSCLAEPSLLEGKPNVKGIILSGGPNSVYDEGSPHLREDMWAAIEARGLPILGICYGLQEIAFKFGGRVAASPKREYGHAVVRKAEAADERCGGLLKGMGSEFTVWMSHGDKLHEVPEGFADIALSDNSEHCAIANAERRIFGLQFHPEVTHTPEGKRLLANFVSGICGCSADWTMGNVVEESVAAIRRQVGDGHVIGAVSGGVDSTVAAVLMARAIGERFHAILVDNGLLRKDEREKVLTRLRGMGINLRAVDASEKFVTALKGITEPELKRRTIGVNFIDVFEDEAAKLDPQPTFLLQGTLYPDVIESVSYKGPSATIKTHHNVGGLKDVMKLELVEPLRELFKDEVRSMGEAMGVPAESVWRHPFPGPGLGIRVLGEVTAERLATLREADAIYLEEIEAAGLYRKIAQAFAVLLPVKSVGVMGDNRVYADVIALRAVESTDYMTANWFHMPYDVLARISTRIINEVHGVSRVTYDISSKPPATIEWE